MALNKKIFIGSDHAGVELKRELLPILQKEFSDFEITDLGTDSSASVDYPEYARLVAERVATESARGILICGSGIGMSIAANKVAGIRAALVWDVTSARLSRQHNDANVLCLGARLTGSEVGIEICRIWLSTEFLGGRHANRVALISKMDEPRKKGSA